MRILAILALCLSCCNSLAFAYNRPDPGTTDMLEDDPWSDIRNYPGPENESITPSSASDQAESSLEVSGDYRAEASWETLAIDGILYTIMTILAY
jgi:hypothetical protein